MVKQINKIFQSNKMEWTVQALKTQFSSEYLPTQHFMDIEYSYTPISTCTGGLYVDEFNSKQQEECILRDVSLEVGFKRKTPQNVYLMGLLIRFLQLSLKLFVE